MTPQSQIQDLTSRLKHLAFMYHTLGESDVPDAEYDSMVRKLQDLEALYPQYASTSSPLKEVGAPVQSSAKTIKMVVPMLSIKTHTDCESSTAKAFDEYIKTLLEVPHVEYCCELKYDGLGLNLRYQKGQLVSANTRGDGYVGEDVSISAMALNSIPKTLSTESPPDFIEIRGECIFFSSDFDELNRKQQSRIDSGIKGVKLYSNARNAAAGLIRRSDPVLIASSNLQYFAYTIGETRGFQAPARQSELLDLLTSWGFRSTSFEVVADPALLCKWHEIVEKKRQSLEFDIDGVVYKVNKVELQDKLGFNVREPKWALAHKFTPLQQFSRVTEITLQVGRTGKITPVAELEPVNINGVIVTRATLHNEDQIHSKNVEVGDTVVVSRAGDVIPEIIQAVKQDDAPLTNFSIYNKLEGKCPSCNAQIVKVGADWRCTAGMMCSAQRIGAVTHFCGKRMMAISGIGTSIATLLVDTGLVHTTSDIYHLDHEHLTAIGLGSLVASNLLKEIEKSKRTTLQKFIYSLGIPCVGEGTSESIAQKYPRFDDLLNTTVEELSSIDGVGEPTAKLIRLYLDQDNNLRNIQRLRDAGVHWSDHSTTSSKIQGLVFVLTGTLPRMSRDVVMDTIRSHGGKVSGTVTSKVNYVIAGEKAGDKLDKAQALGIPILDEDSFLMMLQ